MIFCRLCLEWTSSLWLDSEHLSDESKEKLHVFWVRYLNFEDAIVTASSVLLFSLIFGEKFESKTSKDITGIMVASVYALYRYIKKISLRKLSPLGIKNEIDLIDKEIEGEVENCQELKQSIERILNATNLEELNLALYQEINKFPQWEPILSKAHWKRKVILT